MKLRQIAWILILIVDLGSVAWGAMAAVMPDGLLGPSGKAILPAGYEGSGLLSWSQLLSSQLRGQLDDRLTYKPNGTASCCPFDALGMWPDPGYDVCHSGTRVRSARIYRVE